jgi:hypothetical protein
MNGSISQKLSVIQVIAVFELFLIGLVLAFAIMWCAIWKIYIEASMQMLMGTILGGPIIIPVGPSTGTGVFAPPSGVFTGGVGPVFAGAGGVSLGGGVTYVKGYGMGGSRAE